MCEKRIRKSLKKGPHVARIHEARRIQRIERMPPAANDEAPPTYAVVGIDKAVQNKLIMELAWKTIALMHKNKLIQQKIIALQKETSEFVAAIANNPVHKQRYIDYMTAQGYSTQNVGKENQPTDQLSMGQPMT